MNPYARRYEVQYWAPEEELGARKIPMEHPTSGIWTAFPNGAITDGKGGTATLQLSSISYQRSHPASLDDGIVEYG